MDHSNLQLTLHTALQVGVTEIDSYFHDYFKLNSDGYSGNLNNDNNWLVVMDHLESLCIRKEIRYNTRLNTIETTYEIPLVGYVVFDGISRADMDMLMAGMSDLHQKANNRFMRKYLKQDISQYFEWHGKLYDINFVYRFKYELSNYLVPYCPIVPAKPIISTSKVVEVTDCIYSNRKHTSRYNCSISSSFFRYTYNHRCYVQDNSTDYLEINLLRPTKVTHMGLLGSIGEVDVFPKDYNKGYFRRGNRGRVNSSTFTKKTANHVLVVNDENAASWVTEFELYYRSLATHKWVFISTFLGNSNGYDIKLVDLYPFYNATDGILTQYLRVRPVQYHIRPTLQISIYHYLDETSSDTVCTATKSTASTEAIPTVKYVVNDNTCQSLSYGKCRDGFKRRVLRQDRWAMGWDKKNLTVKKRRSLQRHTQEDMDMHR